MTKIRNITSDVKRSLLLGSAAFVAMSSGAFAQTADPAGDTTIVVTGSRIISNVVNSPTPVTIVSTQQLLQTTPTNIPDGLNKLPVFLGSNSERNASSGGGNASGNFLNLRNFGQQRTLVLLDGMRLPPANQAGSVDVSTLPQTLISRVDVVTAGASSVYGSDAVTGVVNFVLDKNFNGVKYNVNYGISKYGDAEKFKSELAAGRELFDGRGHIEGAASYSTGQPVLIGDRPSGAKHLGSFNSGANATIPNTNIINAGQTVSTAAGKITCNTAAVGLALPCSVNGFEFGTPGVPSPIFYGVIPNTPGASAANTAVASGCPTCAKVDYTSLYSETRNATAFGRFDFDVTNDIHFFAQGSFARAYVFSNFFPMQQEGSRQTTTYFKNNPFLPAATQAALGNNCATNPNCMTDGSNTFQVSEWYNAPDRVRQTSNVTRNLLFATGLDGSIKDFLWEARYTHGETRLTTTGIHNGNNQFHNAAADAVIENGQIKCWNNTAAAIAQFGDLYPGCVPINTFGNNVTSQAAIDYWGRNTSFVETNKLDEINADITGDLFNLPAGPLKVALAGEMRWLDYEIDSNASPTAVVNCTGLRLCGALSTANGHVAQQPGAGFITAANQQYVTQTLWDNNTVPSVHADENVWEVSAEVGVPILADLPFVKSFDADFAGRYTDYSISGSVKTWKIGLNYRVDDNIRFRATTSVDIRAPTLNDLYSPATSNSGPFLDPLTNFNPGGIQTVASGNPTLVPEEARTVTAGFVLTPTFVPGLTISADYYKINLENAIANISGTNLAVANLCIASGGSSPFCQLYDRPFAYTNTTPANYPTLIRSQSLNAAFNLTEGFDYEVDYTFRPEQFGAPVPGQVTLRALANITPKLLSSTFPGAPLQHGFGAGTTTPSQKGHVTVFGDYSVGPWDVNAQWTWFSGLNKNGVYGAGQTFYAQNRVGDFETIDFTINRKIQVKEGNTMQVYFNVRNAANSIPPDLLGSSGNPGGVNTPTGEDLMGRYFTVGIRGSF
jgi:outer membrane receptor protein involved in Fe transport